MHLYKGSASGTYWYDRGTAGFVALGGLNNAASAVSHISAASRRSPFLSFTTSFAIAREYALPFGYTNPGRVYVIDTDIPAAGLVIVDPVKLLAGSHHHNGDSSLVRDLSANLRPQPAHRAHTGAVLHAPNFQQDLEAVVYALRDSELLVYGVVPRACIIDVIDVS